MQDLLGEGRDRGEIKIASVANERRKMIGGGGRKNECRRRFDDEWAR